MRALVEDIISTAVQSAIRSGELPLEDVPEIGVERPRDLSHGDWASSVAMRCAKQAHMNPREIAQIVAREQTLREEIDKIIGEIEG